MSFGHVYITEEFPWKSLEYSTFDHELIEPGWNVINEGFKITMVKIRKYAIYENLN